jgi:endo-1,4-beta-xylanase
VERMTQARVPVQRRQWWLRMAAVGIATACVVACIRRDPASTSKAPSTSSPVSAAPSSTAGALQPATGNYGKVAGVDLLDAQGIHAFQVNGKADRVDVDLIKVNHEAFTQAIRAKIKKLSDNSWDVQIQARIKKPVAIGDAVLVTFYFRTFWAPHESGEGQTELNFELSHEPWTKVKVQGVHAGHDWQKYSVPFLSTEEFKAGEGQLVFRLGYSPETIDIAGVTVENFGKQLALVDLPVTKKSYKGAEPDAAWRSAAAERIDKIRKAELKIVAKDAAGNFLPHAQVTAVLKKHAFGFGTCVPAKRLLDKGNEKYQQELLSMFNTATLENDLKWAPLAKDWGPGFTIERASAAVDWLRSHGLDVRGHVLVWPGWRNLPRYLHKLEKDPAKLREETEKHIREVVGAMKGRLIHWDTLNEPFDNHDLLDILGKEVAVDWFRLARQTDPKPKLFINDYAILSGGGGTTPHRDSYESIIKMLVDKGAQVDGIGMQGHFGETLTGPEDVLSILDRFAKFNKTIWITEYDVVQDDEELGGNFTRDFFTTLFSHPAVGGIVMWGFWDGDHWKNNSAVYRKDWSLKPAGIAYRDLVLGQWRTNVQGETDDTGSYATRGFLGEYDVVVRAGGKQKAVNASLKAAGTQMEVTL